MALAVTLALAPADSRAEWGGVGGFSHVVPPVLNPTASDTDGDGMPNTWESSHFLNPTDSSDATSDFDGDGLTALQEYQLDQSSSGLYGKPEGRWTTSALPVPPGFVSSPSVTLIECSSNGLVLARVQGIRVGSSTSTSWPYTWSPVTNSWTRIAEPTGFAAGSITSLTPVDINSSGQVVGNFYSSGTKGFIWTPAGSGSTEVYTLSSGATTIPAIPRRISDAGYIVGDANYLGGRSFAGTVNGTEFTFPGMWSSPAFFDVNDYGEFVGAITNPYSGQRNTFLAVPGQPVYLTGVVSADLDLPGNWTYVPDIDPGAIVWQGTDSHGFKYGYGVDRLTNTSIPVHQGYYASFYWGENVGLSNEAWYAYMGFVPSLGAINNWGEFAGTYSAQIYITHFSGTPYAAVSGAIVNSGVSFFDGSYHYTQSKPAVYGVSDQPQVLVGTPFALWSGPVVVPVASLIPPGTITVISTARLAGNGRVFVQRSSSNPIYQLKPNQDTDGDGMPDDWEAYYGLNPNAPSDAWTDLDGDGTSNHAEFRYRTDPALATLADGQTLDIRPGIDSDGDGLPNVWEWKHGLNANNASDASADLDGDGLTNLQEFRLGTRHDLADTDGDGMNDAWEIKYGRDPYVHTDSSQDADHDGLNDAEESKNNTDPNNPDSDGDGITDGGEVDQDYGPNNPADTPEAEWFILTGNLEQGLSKSRSRILTIPAGESRLVTVVLASEEYAGGFTGDSSQWNDRLTWSITAAGQTPLNGDINVNSRHGQWVAADADGQSIQGFSPAFVETTKLIKASAESQLTVEIALSATNVQDGSFYSTVLVGILPVKIGSDEGQSGKTGDQIPSNNGLIGEKHYVSPKKSIEVSDDFVVLRAIGIEKEIFENVFEWECFPTASGSTDPDNSNKYRVKRDATGKTVIKIKAKTGGAEMDRMNIWIVWSEVEAFPAEDYLFLSSGDPVDKWSYSSPESPYSKRWHFRFTIRPTEIITADEKPDLIGANTTQPPGHDINHFLLSMPSDHATLKWDTSRQMEVSVLNPALIPKIKFPNLLAFANQPKERDIPLPFPTNPVQGNDDAGGVGFRDEDDNPYEAYEDAIRNDLSHPIGQLSSSDRPEIKFLNSNGVQGSTLAVVYNFKEFARLNIVSPGKSVGDGKGWFRVSDYSVWHYVMAATYGEQPAGSGTFRWVNTGSVSAKGRFDLPEEP